MIMHLPTSRARLCAPAAALCLLLLVGCGSDKKTGSTSTTSTTPAASNTTPATDAPATTLAPPVPASTNPDGSVTISVTVGKDDFATSKGTRVVQVKAGATVTIELTDASVDESYHLHGYDLEVEAKKGATAKINFTADKTGQFDLESHITNDTLLVLVVA
jgi:FtsP/CotA-like multicopper oxidase with cupredoxin domain